MEKVIVFLRKFGYANFKIKDSANRQIAYVMAEDVEEAVTDFMKEYKDLENGKNYKIVVGKNPNFQETRSEFLDFKKTDDTKVFNRSNAMDTDYIDKIKKEAYEQGVKDARIGNLEYRQEKFEEAVNKRFDRFEKVISEKFDELDGGKDNDFLTKLGQLGEVAEPLMNVLGGKTNMKFD